MFKIIKNIKIILVIIKWLNYFVVSDLMKSCVVAVYTVCNKYGLY